MKRKSISQRGVTLMEMVIVVVVIGVIAGMAVPSFLTYMPKLKVKAYARDIVSELRLARSRAVTERRPYGVAFNLEKRAFAFFADTDPGGYSLSDSTIRIDSSGTSVKMSACTFADNCVIFNSVGSASSSGDLQIVSEDGSIVMSINILASTGRVRLTEIGAG